MLRFLCNLADEKEKSLPCVSKTVRLLGLTLPSFPQLLMARLSYGRVSAKESI